jgi:AraC-like DNA-binding protein
MRLLGNPLHAHRKIADVALMAGFNSMSYFHRAFRQRFGMTPMEARAAAKGESR